MAFLFGYAFRLYRCHLLINLAYTIGYIPLLNTRTVPGVLAIYSMTQYRAVVITNMHMDMLFCSPDLPS